MNWTLRTLFFVSVWHVTTLNLFNDFSFQCKERERMNGNDWGRKVGEVEKEETKHENHCSKYLHVVYIILTAQNGFDWMGMWCGNMIIK